MLKRDPIWRWKVLLLPAVLLVALLVCSALFLWPESKAAPESQLPSNVEFVRIGNGTNIEFQYLGDVSANGTQIVYLYYGNSSAWVAGGGGGGGSWSPDGSAGNWASGGDGGAGGGRIKEEGSNE